MFNNNPSIGQELLDVPMGEMIRTLAFAIAEGQMALDENSIEVAEMMGGLKTITKDINGEEVVTFEDSRVFFGQEKVSVTDAVTIYNTTTDEGIKNQIFSEPTYKFVGVDNGGTHTKSSEEYTSEDDKSKATHIEVVGKNTDLYELKDDTQELQLKESASPTISEVFIPKRLSMLELGFTPTFYQFVDTIAEVKLSIKFSREGSSTVAVKTDSKTNSVSAGWSRGRVRVKRNITTSQVNANYSQKFSYSAEGSSLLRTKLVPIPPPAALEQRIQEQMEIAREQASNS